MGGVGRLDAQRIGVVVATDEIVEMPGRTAIVETGLQRVVAAAIHGNMPAIVEHAGLGLDVDDAAGLKAVFGRQRAVDQLDRFRQPGVQRLAEHADAFRQDDAVDAVLQVVVLAADMELAVESCATSGICRMT